MNETGHMLVARVAWDKMTPTARAAVKQLTADPNDPVTGKPTTDEDNDQFTAATWLDDIRPTDGNLHFVNTELDGDGTLDSGPNGVSFENQNIDILKNPQASLDQKAEALRVTMHLTGDLHQPLHCSDNHDRGGNQFKLNWAKNPHENNMHAFWDAGGGQWGLINRPLNSQGQSQLTDMANKVEGEFPLSSLTAEAQDINPADWAHEGYVMAKKDCYNGVQQGDAPSAQYRQTAVHDMDYEAALGGYRLANLLNSIFTGPVQGQ